MGALIRGQRGAREGLLLGSPHVPGTRTHLNGVAGATEEALPARTTCPRHDLDLRTLTSRCAGLRQCTMRAGCHKCSVELPVSSGGGRRGQRCEGSLFRAHEGAATQPPTQICRAAPTPPSYPGPEPDHRYKGEVWGQGTEPGSSSAGGGTVHVCDLTPYLWSC